MALIPCYLPALPQFPALLPPQRQVAFHYQLPVQMGAAQVQFDLPERQLPALWAAAAEMEGCSQNQMAAHPFPAQREVAAVALPLA